MCIIIGEEYFAFGWEMNGGFNNFRCSGNETKLIDCTYQIIDNRGRTYAGVACSKPLLQIVLLLTHGLLLHTIEVATIQEEMGQDCTALARGLGPLVVVMAIGLVGVVLGWVWSCHRKSPIRERHLSGEQR